MTPIAVWRILGDSCPSRALPSAVEVAMHASQVKLIMLDVDGVLTDGRLVYTDKGELTKAFHAHDGCALKLWQELGGQIAILSARAGGALQRRLADLGIELAQTGVQDKLAGYDALLAATGLRDAEVAYVGDDLPDLGPMTRCACPIAVGDAVPTVKRQAEYITHLPGGKGAVAEVVEWLLRQQQRWPGARLGTPSTESKG